MSSSSKVLTVRGFLDRTENNDVDGAHQYVTDDFVYEESKPLAFLGEGHEDEAVLDRVGYKAHLEKIYSHITYKVAIDNITENPQAGKVIVHIKYQPTVIASPPMPPYAGEASFIGEYMFVGDKISKVKVMWPQSSVPPV
ncbi:uncharacterized protein EDB91DRAFT_1087020 [Suillus paluster]|uniref:uncharacterized protein n=1 Tax=Suillus paluster TaxID=48578 RepID=UPI001B85DBEF|nr:uncharacterized protein EDB91DRAFT_1087020 [Suillus paluster]KAG1725708.1 hypothetical protein EDB91DRAFT_1087020 [Suillus paluster]